MFKQCGAQITQAYNKHTGTWSGFKISFTEYVQEISIITLPSHRRRDKSKITPLELSQLRALNGQLLWLGMQCLPQLLAPLSLLMGQTPQATVGTICEVSKLARKATAWARTPLKIHGYVHRCWMDHSPRWHLTRWTVGLHCKLRVAARQRINMSLISLYSIRLRRVARSSSVAETQAAADGDDEAVYIRLCLKEVLFGQLDLRNWQSEARHSCCSGGGLSWCLRCPGSLFVFLSRSERQEIWFRSKCGTVVRWCHSAAQLGDVVTKDSDAARAPWELFVRRVFRWKLIHRPKFESSRNRAKRGTDTLDELEDNQFADDVPRDPKSVTLIT